MISYLTLNDNPRLVKEASELLNETFLAHKKYRSYFSLGLTTCTQTRIASKLLIANDNNITPGSFAKLLSKHSHS